MIERFVFENTDEYPSCHAANICELANGNLLATWYAGSEEGADDSVILGSYFSHFSCKWQKPSVLVNVYGHAAGNPRVFIGPDDGIWLLAPINYGKWCQGGTRLFLKRSYDNGTTWTDLELFIERKGILGRSKPLYIKPKIWIIPAEHETTWKATFIRSEDNGKTWKITGCIGENEDVKLDQPTLVELSSCELLAYMRTWEGRIYQTRSYDKGKTWTSAEPTSLPNNNSGIDMIKLRSGNLLLAFNPVGLGKLGDIFVVNNSLKKGTGYKIDLDNLLIASELELLRVIGKGKIEYKEQVSGYPQWGPRTPLSLAISKDEGKTWNISIDLEKGEGEYSYPTILQDSNELIHIVYTYNRTHIKHVSLQEEELLSQKLNDRQRRFIP
jgi:predicted neuraminidase